MGSGEVERVGRGEKDVRKQGGTEGRTARKRRRIRRKKKRRITKGKR